MTFQRHIDGDLLASIQLFEGLVAIVCAQVAFLQFFEGGIDGVAAGASIVECPFRHVVNDIQECLFVNAPNPEWSQECQQPSSDLQQP